MTADLVLYELRPPAALLTLNRPDRRNALNGDLIAALAAAVRRAADDPKVRCLILTGAGPAFCAGLDLAELAASLATGDEGASWDETLRLGALYDLIYNSPKPSIAAVNGPAVAGGAGLVCVCDLAVAAADARLGYPGVRRGLVAPLVMPHLLRHVGERLARYLLLTGEFIEAPAALQAGLVNAVVAGPEVLGQAQVWARSLAEGGPQAMAATRSLLNSFSSQASAVTEVCLPRAVPQLTQESRLGLEAFLGRHQPPWSLSRQGH